jgi:hypothetical protein
VIVSDKNICLTVIDEGASTCVMSLACWKAISSPSLNESQNTLKSFNGSGFNPYGVLPCKVAREVVGGPRGPIVIIVEVILCKVD